MLCLGLRATSHIYIIQTFTSKNKFFFWISDKNISCTCLPPPWNHLIGPWSDCNWELIYTTDKNWFGTSSAIGHKSSMLTGRSAFRRKTEVFALNQGKVADCLRIIVSSWLNVKPKESIVFNTYVNGLLLI